MILLRDDNYHGKAATGAKNIFLKNGTTESILEPTTSELYLRDHKRHQ